MTLRQAQGERHPSIAGIPLVLGGNVFAWTANGDEGRAVLDAFYEAGGRMIDTADVYSAWIPGHVGGESERYLGEWLESRGVRRDMRIHTKTGMLPRGGGQHTFGAEGDPNLYQPAEVLVSLDASLERLRTDYLDLYYAHRDYPALPAEQIVAAFDGAVKSGKVREIGASNFAAERLSAALIAADLGRKATGWGFVLFCAVSVTWIVSGLTSGAPPIAAMNGILLLINLWGVWQFLLSPKNKAELEKLEELEEQAEREAAA